MPVMSRLLLETIYMLYYISLCVTHKPDAGTDVYVDSW